MFCGLSFKQVIHRLDLSRLVVKPMRPLLHTHPQLIETPVWVSIYKNEVFLFLLIKGNIISKTRGLLNLESYQSI